MWTLAVSDSLLLLSCRRRVFASFFSTSTGRLERLRPEIVPLRTRKNSKVWSDHYRLQRKGSCTSFVDWRRVRVVAGDGGDGGISMLSVFGVEFAGPDGGNGGNGGHVIFKAVKNVSSLEKVEPVVLARHGVPGSGTNRDGKNAEHRLIEVPVGTLFRNLEREVVAELVEEGAMFLAAKGGAGGRGNAFFKTSVRQAPMLAEAGGKGETFTFDVELRSMAHVGLIGFPNAGKSTLLRAISRARPKVAAYPFTTLNPHIGMVQYEDYEQLAVADIPGIIQDAHKNKGLGISFLRHIERCLCLVYVIDLSQPDPIEQFQILRNELEQYQTGLSLRPHGIVANKVDLDSAKANMEMFEAFAKEQDVPVFYISGKMGLNLRAVLIFMREMCDRFKAEDNLQTTGEKIE